jgi:hypothetical protein
MRGSMSGLTLAVAVVVLPPYCLVQTKTSPTQITRQSSRAEKPETSHLVFVTECIRELAAIENIRESGQEELKQNPDSMFSNMIHSSTLFQLELGSQIRMLRGMRLKSPFDFLIPSIASFYEHKVILWKRMGEISSAFIGGPKPSVDYDKLAAELPKIRGQLDFIDKGLFDASPGIFATLIDLKADSAGHANHLVIAKEERTKLIDSLDTAFGSKMDAKDQNWIVSSASVLKAYLLKDFKSSDEPWE